MVLSCAGGAHGHNAGSTQTSRVAMEEKTLRDGEGRKKIWIPRILSSRRVTCSRLSRLSKQVFSPRQKAQGGEGAASADGGRKGEDRSQGETREPKTLMLGAEGVARPKMNGKSTVFKATGRNVLHKKKVNKKNRILS